jgi:hypothetical protein
MKKEDLVVVTVQFIATKENLIESNNAKDLEDAVKCIEENWAKSGTVVEDAVINERDIMLKPSVTKWVTEEQYRKYCSTMKIETNPHKQLAKALDGTSYEDFYCNAEEVVRATLKEEGLEKEFPQDIFLNRHYVIYPASDDLVQLLEIGDDGKTIKVQDELSWVKDALCYVDYNQSKLCMVSDDVVQAYETLQENGFECDNPLDGWSDNYIPFRMRYNGAMCLEFTTMDKEDLHEFHLVTDGKLDAIGTVLEVEP